MKTQEFGPTQDAPLRRYPASTSGSQFRWNCTARSSARTGSEVYVKIGADPEDPQFVINDLLPHLGREAGQKAAERGHSV